MDIQDVSDSNKYTVYLDGQKAAFRASIARKGEVPKDRKSRQRLLQEHLAQHAATQLSPGQSFMQINVIGEPYLPSAASIKDLKKMTIKQLQIDIHHRGFYLLLRLIVPPVRMTAVISLAEDEGGDSAVLSLYRQENEHIRPAADILKEKSVILLKEPYFKCVGSGGYGIRVDHPTDIVWLSSDDPNIPAAWRPKSKNEKTVEQLKQEGNALSKHVGSP